jgi:hypothetical protein
MPFNRSHIKIPGIEWSEMDQHLRSCVDVGLLRIRTEGQEGGFVSPLRIFNMYFYYVPLEFRETLKRLLYIVHAPSNSFNSHT